LIDADELLTAFPVDDEPTLTKSCVRMTIQHMPTVDAVPVTWIEGEIKWLKEMDNPFATMSAGQIEAMLKRWKDGDHHEG
jgi:hypothetical protein